MTERNHEQIAKDHSQDAVDRLLDAALAKYASVEPRPGLDQRIMANLNAEQFNAPSWCRWRWTLYAGAAVMVLFTLILIWRPRPGKPNVADGGAQTPRSAPQAQVGFILSGSTGSRTRISRHKITVPRPPRTVATNAPKRDEFPSPQPLSEQEKVLASYVEDDPHHAVLIARAQAELERRDHEEEMREMDAGSDHDSEQTQQ